MNVLYSVLVAKSSEEPIKHKIHLQILKSSLYI